MFVKGKKAAWLLAAGILAAGIAAPVNAQPAAGAPAKPAEPPAKLDVIAGEWSIALEGLPGGPQVGQLKAKVDGEKASGEITTSLGVVTLDSITVEGPNHVFSFMIDAIGQSMDVMGSVKVAGSELKGSLLIASGAMEAGVRGAKKGTPEEAALLKDVEAKRKEYIGEPTLPVDQVKDMMGQWVFSAESPLGTMDIEFELVDVGGKASGLLKMPAPLGTQTINRLTKTEAGGLQLVMPLSFGGQDINMSIDLKRDGQLLAGTLDITDLGFSFPLEGVRKGRGLAKLSLMGKTVVVEYGRPSVNGPGYKTMSTVVKDGYVWRMGKDHATTLKTDVDLKFGDTVVKAGTYSLWAKRAGDSWNLIFNTNADVWGTKYDSKADVAGVPLTAGKAAAPTELFTASLKAEMGQGVFRMSWGPDEYTGKFSLVLPPPPAPAGGAAK